MEYIRNTALQSIGTIKVNRLPFHLKSRAYSYKCCVPRANSGKIGDFVSGWICYIKSTLPTALRLNQIDTNKRGTIA